MSEVMTKQPKPTKAPFSWRSLIAELAGKRERAIADYGDLVDRLAAGEELSEAAVESALTKAGKSPFDLESDVAERVERREWAAEIERLRTTVADGEQAHRDDEAAIQRHNAAVERMLAELDKVRSGLRPRVHAGTAAAAKIDELESKLRKSAPAHLGEQQFAIRDELTEAVTALNRHDDYLDRNRVKWRAAVQRDEPLGDMSVAACSAALKEQERVRETLAARVSELQGQMDAIEQQKVQP